VSFLHSARKAFAKLSDYLNKGAEVFLIIDLAAMTVVVFTQVVFRFLRLSIPWSEEFARYSMIFLTFVGASVGVKYKSHIAVEALATIMPEKIQEIGEVVGDIILMFAFYILIYYGGLVAKMSLTQKSPAMHVHMGYIYASLVIGGILMTIHALNNLVSDLVVVFTKKRGEKAT